MLLWCVQAFLALTGAVLLATIMLGALTAQRFILHVPLTAPGVLLLLLQRGQT